MNDEQFAKLMTLLVAIYQEIKELNNTEIDLSPLEGLGFTFEED